MLPNEISGGGSVVKSVAFEPGTYNVFIQGRCICIIVHNDAKQTRIIKSMRGFPPPPLRNVATALATSFETLTMNKTLVLLLVLAMAASSIDAINNWVRVPPCDQVCNRSTNEKNECCRAHGQAFHATCSGGMHCYRR
ncbi:Psychimicin [Eumeta japonica]|uniref:Psychimicin n=1 Tax=Eumeta variegata TaxID=151549 RepID=A0A4C1Y8Y5_EUMVA|nr:Psychimicin [Eumeta japonica]